MEIKDILEKIALPARSKKKGFKNTEKLDAIEALLKEENSPYYLIRKHEQAWIFGKKEPKQDEKTLLVSTHADIVDTIEKPFSKYKEDEKYFVGTYDNLGTNAACVYMMLNKNLSDNIYFAFTADEETGRCNGANFALAYIKHYTKKDPLVFALDVTEEGYDNDRLYTIEGLHGKTEDLRKRMLQIFMETEGNEQSFEVIRLKKKDDNSFLPESYQAKDTIEYDESVFYARKGCNSLSMCLPGDGYMHYDSGFYVKEAVMKGYLLGLESGLIAFTSRDKDRLDEIKIEKDELVNIAKETKFHKQKSNYNSYFTGYYHDYYDKEDDSQIPGQLHLSDFDKSFKIEDDLSDENEWHENDPFLLDELYTELYEAAYCYNKMDFKMFYKDMINYYSLKNDDELKFYLKEIFKEAHMEYDEEYEYEDY